MATVLITGASGGIGLELAKIFAKDGYDLVLTARSENKLLEIQKELNRLTVRALTFSPATLRRRTRRLRCTNLHAQIGS